MGGCLFCLHRHTLKLGSLFLRGDARLLEDQLDELKAQSRHWVSKSRSAVKREVQLLLSKVEHAELEMGGIVARMEYSRQNVSALLDNRQSLLQAVGQMAPKAALQQAQAECSALALEVERLTALVGQKQKEADGLTVRVQATQTEVDKLLKLMQVAPRRPALPCAARCAPDGAPGRKWCRARSSWRRKLATGSWRPRPRGTRSSIRPPATR